MPTLEHGLPVEVNVSVDGAQEMAGFAVSINGRFWVSTEGCPGHGTDASASPHSFTHKVDPDRTTGICLAHQGPVVQSIDSTVTRHLRV